ncbi:MAG: formate--tetrahydrofolate ligase [Spirochaetales bacterium]|nr:formate--tetrahydrofolate ligase [Spirochaetales bacterium]
MSVTKENPVPSDLKIAQSARLRPIQEIARRYGLVDEDIIAYGDRAAKIKLSLPDRPSPFPQARYIDVTALTPTPLGEGKTTTTVGLTEGLAYLGHKSLCSIRQPSMGPTFGIKGGAAGGGYSQIVPMEDFNLHLTGDIHAVGAAHNLGAAAVDSRIYHEGRWGDKFLASQGITRLNPDPTRVLWRRVVDINDRSLRNIITGLGERGDGPVRQTGFDITVASELMAILALATSLGDMRNRIGRVIMALDKKGRPLTAEDFGVAGAMAVLLKDALLPNLLQTLEEQAALVHTGPFGNIAHGNSSVIADLMGRNMADYLVTESGFGSDMGLEKFIHIKCRPSGLLPRAAVLVVTVRALKMHGGGPSVVPGKPLDRVYSEKNRELVRKGCANMTAHIAIARRFGLPVVVAVNAFPTDSTEEWEVIREEALKGGALESIVSHHWEHGGEGAAALARAVAQASESEAPLQYLYEPGMSLREKIDILARQVYGASRVEFTGDVQKKMDQFADWGYGTLPVCMAKTQYSLSHDPRYKNVPPPGYVFPVQDIRLSAGAGFVYPLAGDIRTMPGLGSRPAYMDVDIDRETGRITGLF